MKPMIPSAPMHHSNSHFFLTCKTNLSSHPFPSSLRNAMTVIFVADEDDEGVDDRMIVVFRNEDEDDEVLRINK